PKGPNNYGLKEIEKSRVGPSKLPDRAGLEFLSLAPRAKLSLGHAGRWPAY
ncbi:hypothetical protein PanWU01x14_175260, partial [Parasponia andersonii]